MRKTLFSITSTAMMLLLSVAITLAQGECAEFIGRALEAVDASCNGIGRNQACYGFTRVEASFQMEVAEDFFTEPADTSDITEIETIRTAPFNIVTDEWGVAVLVLQANMPETLPGQNVTFVLMGDTELENAVAPEDAYQPIAGIDVTVSYPQGAAVRSGPGDNFNTIGGVVVGHVFNSDGISDDGNWLRVIWEERPAWVRRSTIDPIPEIESLPIFNEDLRSPMQAFYLRTGIGQPTCNEVPDNSLLVQGPEDIEIQLTVNGANIELGSSGILRVIEVNGEPMLEIVVLDGEFVIKADEHNPQDVIIRAGQRSTLCLQDGNNEGLNGEADDLLVTCAASTPEQIDIFAFREDWCKLEAVPLGLLNYELSTCFDNTHTIQAGENLFRISQFYCVTLDELTAINGIVDPAQIFVGQVLILPASACDGSGSTRPPAGVVLPDTPTDEGGDTPSACGISLISPLGDINSGNHTFSWTAVSGANISYQLVFFNFEGNEVESFFTNTTSYTLNLGQQTSTGGQFSWEVHVLQNEQFLCTSSRSPVMIRTGELNPRPSAFMTVNCSYPTIGQVDATVTWSSLPSGETISITLTDGVGTAVGGPFTTATGSQNVSLGTYSSAVATATSTLGDVVSVTC